MELAKAEGVDLSDEQLEAISGGGKGYPWHCGDNCGVNSPCGVGATGAPKGKSNLFQ